MPELRKDPVLGRWVIISTERALRPADFIIPPEPPSKGVCPFCPGNEHMTPPPILIYRNQGSTDWRVRVVPNKFPALRIEGDLEKRGDGIYDRMNGIGAHEVIIETTKHVTSLTDLPPETTHEVLQAYYDRLSDLKKDRRFNYGMIFKNVGALAGASLEHTHSQLIALPTIPIRVRQEMKGSQEFFGFRGRCIFCDMIRQELDQKVRMVSETRQFIAFEPFAARFAFETWIVPKNHRSHFEHISPDELHEFSIILHEVLRKLEKALNRPPYNYMIHTSPFVMQDLDYYHWHLEITPRLTKVAGFEWGTGFYINSVPPEQAAQFLREANSDISTEPPR